MKIHKLKLLVLIMAFLSTAYMVNAQTVTLSAPSSATTYVDNVTTLFNISDGAGTPQQIQVVFTCTSGPCLALPFTVMTLTMKANTTSQSFMVKSTDMSNSSNAYTANPSSSMGEGYYSVYCQYTRPAAAGSTVVRSTTKTNVYIDNGTQTPVIRKPASGVAIKTNSTRDSLGYNLPEPYLSGSASLTFLNNTINKTTVVTLADNLQNNTVSLNTNRLLSNTGFSAVTAANDTTLADGSYTLTLSYQDRFSHPAASTTSSLVIDNHTLQPIINSPASNASLGDSIGFNVSIPENYAPDSLYLVFSKTGSSDTVKLVNTIPANSNQLFSLHALNIRGSSVVASSTTSGLASGTYNIKLSYTDTLKNKRMDTSITNIFIGNTVMPVIAAGGVTTVCSGNTVTLTSNASGGNQWYLNGNIIPGATGTTYAASATGDYTAVSTYAGANYNGYTSPASAAVTVTINSLPTAPVVTNMGDTSFCSGLSTVLKSDSPNGNQWYLNGTPISGATDTAYTAAATGAYTLVHTNTNGCTSAASIAKNITVYSLPSAPLITATDSTTIYNGSRLVLASSGISGIQWYKDSVALGGATANIYSATVAGNYTATFTDSNHCVSSASNVITVQVVPLPATTNRNGSNGTREAVNKNGGVIQLIHH